MRLNKTCLLEACEEGLTHGVEELGHGKGVGVDSFH